MDERQRLHAALQEALAAPVEADCRLLGQLLEDAIASQPDAVCLQIGGDAIALIAEVLYLKMMAYQEVNKTDVPDEIDSGFPVLDDDDHAYERHTMSLDLESDEEEWGKPKKVASRRAPNDSVAAPVPPKHVLKMLQDLAGDEDPTGWSVAISAWLKRKKINEPIPIAQIHQSMRKLSIVELWLGLLLGGFVIEEKPNTDETFYHDISDGAVWLIQT